MASPADFLAAAFYLPRRNRLLTADVEEALWGLQGAGFDLDRAGKLRVVSDRRTPEVGSDPTGALVYDGAHTIDQAVSLLRRVTADRWGQIMLRGRFPIGGHFEEATAVVCPLGPDSQEIVSVHLLFRKAGLLFKDRSVADRVAHTVEAVDRLQDALASLIGFLDAEQPEIRVGDLKRGKLPWLPWAGYFSPGALRVVNAGGMANLHEWLAWLESTLNIKGSSASRSTRGGGLVYVLPSRTAGRWAPHESNPALAPWLQFLRSMARG